MTKAEEVLDAFRELQVGDTVEFYAWTTHRIMRGRVARLSTPTNYIMVIADTETYMRYRDELTYVPE